MALALQLADRATAVARPNPGVGCVLLRGDRVLATGATQRAGGAHAEVVALEAAGPDAAGATAVVTLEPCDHVGRTGPCSRALLDAGIARVVIATADPGDRASGGARRLREAGVDVEVGLFAEWAEEVHHRFLVAATRGRPYVTLKVARTADGALALRERRWVTGPEARTRVHELRALADAVLVGVGTVLADDPRLDARGVAAPAGQPRPVVLDSLLRTPPGARVLGRGALVLATPGADRARAAALRGAGAEVTVVEATAAGRLDLAAALRALRDAGIESILAEPGATLQEALWRAGLVDELVLHVAPDVADAADLPTVPLVLGDPFGHDVRRVRALGRDLELVVRPRG